MPAGPRCWWPLRSSGPACWPRQSAWPRLPACWQLRRCCAQRRWCLRARLVSFGLRNRERGQGRRWAWLRCALRCLRRGSARNWPVEVTWRVARRLRRRCARANLAWHVDLRSRRWKGRRSCCRGWWRLQRFGGQGRVRRPSDPSGTPKRLHRPPRICPPAQWAPIGWFARSTGDSRRGRSGWAVCGS